VGNVTEEKELPHTVKHAEETVQKVVEHARMIPLRVPQTKPVEQSIEKAEATIKDVTSLKESAEKLLSGAAPHVWGLKWGSEEERKRYQAQARKSGDFEPVAKWGSTEEQRQIDVRAGGSGSSVGGEKWGSEVEQGKSRAPTDKSGLSPGEGKWVDDFPQVKARKEARYAELSMGHENPPTIVKTQEEAKTHSEETLKKAQAAELKPNTLVMPEFAENAQEKNIKLGHIESVNNEISGRWLDKSYLGSELGRRFAQTPPVVTLENSEFFSTLSPTLAVGIYLSESNHITIDGRYDDQTKNEDMHRIVTHEQLHYAAWLGGGQNIRWHDEVGDPVIVGYISWLHEGATELFAQELTREHGLTPNGVAYPYETTSALMMENLVGKDILKKAYLSGDFSDVRKIMDQKLGVMSFIHMANLENGAEAVAFLRAKLEIAKIDYSRWAKNPIAVSAGVIKPSDIIANI
jgi:hypothetical protein